MHATVRRQVGFTLIELMIVVGVVAILAMIALPMYAEQTRKGKRAEAAQALGDMQLRQESWRADNPLYGTMDNLTGSAGQTTAFNNALKHYTVSVAGNDATAYTLTATRKGDMATDPKCGNFTLVMNAGILTKGVSAGDTAYCWRQ
jgi:type IV pilus assembly protein PilE